MDRSTFDETMAWTLKHYGVTREVEDLWITFGSVEDEIFIAAINVLIREEVTFPGVFQISAAVAAAREARRIKDKKERSERLSITVPRGATPMGGRAFTLLERTKLPKDHPDFITSKQMAIIMITDLEQEFPGHGWKEEGRRLLDWIESRPEVEERRKTSIFEQRREGVRQGDGDLRRR